MSERKKGTFFLLHEVGRCEEFRYVCEDVSENQRFGKKKKGPDKENVSNLVNMSMDDSKCQGF